jgi:hypothetical protein
VRRFALKTDPMANDPGRWGHSLINLAEIVVPALDEVAPRSIVEVGAYAGDVTRLLVEWAADSDTRIWSIDPDPQPALVRLAAEESRVELVRKISVEALPELPAADVVILDGDHNYHTVSEELRLVAARAGDCLPLVICHDVGWPHGRRDCYYAPKLIPREHRQQTVAGGFLFPGDSGLHSGGLPYRWPAVGEGGPGNGVLTAIEDFVGARGELRLAIVPAFFGLALIWPLAAPWAGRVAEIVEPWEANSLLERLEGNRVLHLAAAELARAQAGWCADRVARRDAFLRKLLESKTFSVAVWLSGRRQRGAPAFSKDEVRRLLQD